MSDQEQATPQNNIYAAPASDLTSAAPSNQLPIAGRGERFGAALIDGILVGAISFAIIIGYVGGWASYMTQAQTPTFMLSLMSAFVGLVIYLGLNFKFLSDNGQTIGKKLVGIKIVRTDGSKLDFQRFVTHRYLPMVGAQLIPIVGMFIPFVDALLIFRSSNQCLHDQIADTIVIDVTKQTNA